MIDIISEKENEKGSIERSLVTAGQRRINIIWEITQALIAISVTIASLIVAATLAFFLLLSNAFFVIIGFYFGRTNHQRTGGVGVKDDQER